LRAPYTAAREIFAMRALWEHIEGLDNKVPARLSVQAAFQTSACCGTDYWLLTRAAAGLQVDAAWRVPERRAELEA